MKTKIVIAQLYKFKKVWRVKKANKVVNLMNQVINADLFKEKVLAWEFTDRRYKHSPRDEYKDIEDNQEIYEILMKGNEQNSTTGDDYTWKLYIKLGRGLRQVGRREGDLIITQNWFYKRQDNEAAVAAHWFHEYSHVLGFQHDYEDTERRPNSVPYALGTIVEKVIEELGLN